MNSVNCKLTIVRAGELPLSLISSSTRENGPCTSPEQHGRADHVGGRVGASPKAVSMGKLPHSLLVCLAVARVRERCPPYSSPL